MGLVFTGMGLLVSGGLITFFKPSARVLVGWNMFVESLDAIGHYLFIFIGCPLQNLHGSQNPDYRSDKQNYFLKSSYNFSYEHIKLLFKKYVYLYFNSEYVLRQLLLTVKPNT